MCAQAQQCSDEEVLPQRVVRKRRRERADVAAAARKTPSVEQGLQQPEPPPPPAGPPAATADAGADHQAPAPSSIHLPEYRSEAVEGYKFEYLDHTADVQLHGWGESLEEAFENVALCMFNYMTPLAGIAVDESLTRTYEAEGHDLQSLLFNFLDELLFTFSTEFFVCKAITITSLDRAAFRIAGQGRGEKFDRTRHAAGTEVKAITYSAMQIKERPGDAEVFVIVDI